MKWIGAVSIFFLLMTGTALAEQKLLITDVLDAGQVEGLASFEIAHAETDFDFGAFEEEAHLNLQETRYSLGVGLGHAVEAYASIPYVIFEKVKIADEEEEVDGFGDLTLGVKYRPLTEEEFPFTLAVGFDVKFDSAPSDGAGTDTTDYSPYVAVSKEMAEQVEGYAAYRATITNHAEPDEHELTLGVEAELSETVTLDAAVFGSHFTSEDEISGFEAYGAEVAAYLQMVDNLYLIPSIGVSRTTSYDFDAEGVTVDVDPVTTYSAGLALYYLY